MLSVREIECQTFRRMLSVREIECQTKFESLSADATEFLPKAIREEQEMNAQFSTSSDSDQSKSFVVESQTNFESLSADATEFCPNAIREEQTMNAEFSTSDSDQSKIFVAHQNNRENLGLNETSYTDSSRNQAERAEFMLKVTRAALLHEKERNKELELKALRIKSDGKQSENQVWEVKGEIEDAFLDQKVQWKWDNFGQMVPYTHVTNAQIENDFIKFQKYGTPTTMIIQTNNGDFCIDFLEMQQYNITTGIKQAFQWYWLDYRSNEFCKYPKNISVKIEEMFSVWKSEKKNQNEKFPRKNTKVPNPQKHLFYIQLGKKLRTHQIDVENLLQKNLATGNAVKIKRQSFILGAKKIQRIVTGGKREEEPAPDLYQLDIAKSHQEQVQRLASSKDSKAGDNKIQPNKLKDVHGQEGKSPQVTKQCAKALYDKVQWKWEDNSHQMVPYSQMVNACIEMALQTFQEKGKPTYTIVVVNKQKYSIDFLQMQQVNLQKGAKHGVQWYWQDYESKKFNKYSKDISIQIEITFNNWASKKIPIWSRQFICYIQIGRKTYEVNVRALTQKNTKTGNVVKIKREEFTLGPRKIQRFDLEKEHLEMKESQKKALVQLPEFWDLTVDQANTVLLSIPSTSDEYKKVEFLFQSQVPQKRVIQLQRVQNLKLWRIYHANKISMNESKERYGANEKTLWHGTQSDTVSKIVEQGFNRSFCGRNATAYGNGVYFAVSASYSSSRSYSVPDQNGIQTLILAQVAVGEYTQGRSGLKAPPEKKGNKLYDSVVDFVESPRMYIVFSDPQAYPAYILKFK